MFDEVTLKLNADPLILSALKEDITSEDVSTNSVMPVPKKGEVNLICKQDGVICGLQIFERVFTLLDENTEVEFKAADGDKVKKGKLLVEFDMDAIKKEGYDLITPVVVTNISDYIKAVCMEKEDAAVNAGDKFLTIV